jgi:hypothetical protein
VRHRAHGELPFDATASKRVSCGASALNRARMFSALDCNSDSIVKQRRGHGFAFSRREVPEVCVSFAPSRTEGAGKAGCALHPRSRVQMHKEMRTRAYRSSGGIPAFPARWFYGLYRALLGDRAFLPPSPLRSLLLTNLTPASGCQDHTTSPYATRAFVLRAHRVHRIPPHVRDDREPPLLSGETGGFKSLICPTAKAEYFYLRGWTDFW